MWDVALALCASSCLLWGPRVAGEWSGLPLMLACLSAAWHAGALPPSVYAHAVPSPLRLGGLAAATDFAQCAVHAWLHATRCTALRRVHQVHHAAVRPRPRDAFRAHAADALLQLVLPVWGALWAARPSRTDALLFGVFYSNWLVYLHSAWPDHGCPLLVAPSDHRAHHAAPGARAHLSHLVRWRPRPSP